MWHREYRDYKVDEPLIQQEIEPSKGICGCEMHEINGWGNTLHHHKKKKKGFIASFVSHLFSFKEDSP